MPTYSLLSEAWSDPIMKQTQKGNFIVDSNLNNEEDDEQLKNNVPPNYSKLLNSVYCFLKSGIDCLGKTKTVGVEIFFIAIDILLYVYSVTSPISI